MAASHVAVACILFSAIALVISEEGRHSRFEYKHSFKGPHLVNKQGHVPFWNHYGSAIASDDQVRITPSLKDQRGGLWAKTKNTNKFWEMEVNFRVSGRGRVGGDGLAIWFTEEAGKPGPVFGSSDNWKGMGLFFDSFDNDGEQNNPYIMVMLNDGTKQYDHFKDGNNQQLGGCMRDFRNRPHPVRAKIRYYNNILTVFYHGGMTDKDEDYELCMRAENVELPSEGFFGISAATGGLADDHDVLKILTHSLTPPLSEEEQKKRMITDEQRKKYEDQYGEYQQKLETKREEFQKEHPDKKAAEEKYESLYDRHVRMIYEGQNSVHQIVRDLHSKTGELTREVNNLHTSVNSKQQGSDGNSGINKQEINTLISLQNQVKSAVDVLQHKTGNGVDPRKIEQIEQNLRTVLENVGHLLSKNVDGGKKPSCPTQNCVTTSYFVFFLMVQMLLIVAYQMYQKHVEQANKKFY